MSSTRRTRTLTGVAPDLCRECRDIATWYSSIPKNQLIGATLVAETAARGHLGCLRAALSVSTGKDLCLNGSRRIVPARSFRGNPLTHEEARTDNIEASLFAAGWQIIEANSQQVLETLQRKFSLKDICRRKIREHLLNLDMHGLPTSLTAYVLYDITLDDDDEHAEDSDDLFDDVISNCSLDVAVGSDIDDYSNSDVSDDDVSVDNGGGGEDTDTDSEDNDDNSNSFSLDVAVGNDVDDCTSGGVFDDNDDDDYNHDCSLDVTVGTDYSNRTHDTVFGRDNDDDCDDDDYSLAVAIGSDIDNYSYNGGQDLVGDSDEDEDDDDDDSSDGNPDVIDSDGYDSGNGSSLVIVSCDDEDGDNNNDGSLVVINSNGYDSGDGSSLDVVSIEDDDDTSNSGSLDVVDGDNNDDDNVNLDLASSDDDDDDDDDSCSLVVVIDSDDDDDVANVDSLDPISNDDSNDTHRDYLNVDFPLKHLEYLDLRIKELDPRTQIFNRALYMFNQ